MDSFMRNENEFVFFNDMLNIAPEPNSAEKSGLEYIKLEKETK